MKTAAACLAVLTLVPSLVTGQTLARTYADLLAMLAPRDRVVVTDVSGRETMGPIETVSSDAFTMAVTVKTPTGSITGAERRTFREADIRSVRRIDNAGIPGPVIYPVSWARVDALPAGSLLRVSFTGGKTEAYQFASASPDALTVTGASRQQQTISKSAIDRVVREQHRDGVGDGIAFGTLIGAGSMALITAVLYANCDAGCEAPAPGPFFAISIGMGAGIGAGAGWLVDRLHKGSEVVFPVAAVVTPGLKAVYLTRRF